MSRKMFWVGVLFIFAILFRPPILPVDLLIPLTVVSAYGIFREVRHKSFDFKKFFLAQSIGQLLRWSALIILLSAVAVTIGFLTSDDYSVSSAVNAAAKLAWTFWLFPINIIYLFILFQKNKTSVDTVLRMILYATLLQAIMAIAAYLIPEVKNIFISIMQANNWSERWTLNNAADQRMNGLAKSLFDTFGYGMGILAGAPLILAFRTKNLKYLLSLPLIFFAIFVNSRTGLVIFAIVVSLLLILLLRHYRQFIKYKNNVLIALLLFITVPIGIHLSSSAPKEESTFSAYTENDINSYIAFLQTGGSEVGNYGGQADVLFSDKFWTLPENGFQLLLGSGLSVYGPDSPFEFSSDVGYVNSIWYLGIVGLVIFHLTILVYIWKITGYEKYWRYFAVAAILSVLIVQIKGSVFWSANLGISATMLLLAVSIYQQKNEKRDRNEK